MKKRLLSLLLAVCVMAAMLPVMTTAAKADGPVGYLEKYVMQAGDTVIAVCNKKGIDFNTNANYIARINGITNYANMKVGQTILLPVKTSSGADRYTLLQHTIQTGETLQSICINYSLDYASSIQLMTALNTNINNLIVGQTIILPIYVAPIGSATPSPAPTAAPTATPAPGTSAAPTATPAPANTDPVKFYLKQHIMQAGETVYGVTEANGLVFTEVYNDLVKYNPGTNFNWIMPGKAINVPVKTQPTSGSYYKVVEHTVLAGEAMYGLCGANGIDYYGEHKLIEAINNNPNVDWLIAGHKVLLPIPVKGIVTLPGTGAGTGGAVVTPAPAVPGTGTTTPAPVSPGTSAAPVVTATPAPTTNDPVKYYLKQHIVQAGDTAIGICAANGLDFNLIYNDLLKYNPNVNLGWLMPGNTVWLPMTTQPTSGSYYKILEHTIVAGDTMYGLCAANGLIFGNVQDMLTKLNANLYYLLPGQKVLIPVLVQGTVTLPLPGTGTGTTTPAPLAPTATPATGTDTGTGTTTPAPIGGGTATAAPTATPQPTGDFVKYYMELYTIQPGDTMSGICAAKGVQYEQIVDLLTKFNKNYNVTFNVNNIIAGHQMWFPVTTQPAAPYYKLIQHTLVAGDTIYGLCVANGLDYYESMDVMKALNANYYNPIAGQTFLIPVYVK